MRFAATLCGVLLAASSALAQTPTKPPTYNPLTTYFTNAPSLALPPVSSDVLGVVRSNVLYKLPANSFASPHVATKAALAAAVTANYPNGVWRNDHSTGRGAGPLFYAIAVGSCVANGRVNDGGSCVDDSSGNSFYVPSWPGGVVDVLQFDDVTGDGTTDDTAGIQAAINAAAAGTGGGQRAVLFRGSKTYCVKTGPITSANISMRFIGQQMSAHISACGADVTIFDLSAAQQQIENLVITGSTTLGTTKPTVQLSSGCSQCIISTSRILYGKYALLAEPGEVWIGPNVKMNSTYGTAVVLMRAGGYIFRSQIDQAWPVSTPTLGHAAISAWAGTTAYSLGDLVTVTTAGVSYRLQASVAGTSGSSEPAAPAYTSTVTDGTVTWKLVGATTYYGIQCDTSCGADLSITQTDLTGSFSTAFAMTNSLAGTAPSFIHFSDNTIGAVQDAALSLQAGANVFLNNNAMGCQFANCSVIITSASWNGSLSVVGGKLAGNATNANGISLTASSRTNINGVIFGNLLTGISVSANIGSFSATGNDFGQAVTSALTVAAGTSNFYYFIGNSLGGATISDAGTGTSKIVQYAKGLAQTTSILQAAPSNPTATTSTTGVMAGMGGACSFTLGASTRIHITFEGQARNDTANDGVTATVSWGTGSAPANGDAITGTQAAQAHYLALNNGAVSNLFVPFSATYIATGLTPGTTYWIDVVQAAVTGGTATLANMRCRVREV